MPIYEYRCPHCNKVFEEWVHLSDAQSMVPCPDCGTESPRIISETSFVLRGVTDYGYRKGIKDEDSKPTTGSTSSSAPKETKAAPAAKPAATAAGK